MYGIVNLVLYVQHYKWLEFRVTGMVDFRCDVSCGSGIFSVASMDGVKWTKCFTWTRDRNPAQGAQGCLTRREIIYHTVDNTWTDNAQNATRMTDVLAKPHGDNLICSLTSK